MLSERMLVSVLEERPENLMLADTPQVLEFLDDERNDADLRREALAELIVRWCLSGNRDLGTALSARLPSWRSFSDWYNIQLPWQRERTLPEGPMGVERNTLGLTGVEVAVRGRLARLFRAVGFIPVCNDLGAWFLPFEFDDMVDGIVWQDGESVEVWCEPVRRALAGTGVKGVRLQVQKGPEVESVHGDSLMLPIHLAALRQSEERLPLYDPLRVLATGRFDSTGRLADVAVRRKFEAMKTQFRDAVLFMPDAPDEELANDRQLNRLDCGLDEEDVVKEVRRCLERQKDLVKTTAKYAMRRLPDMQIMVDRHNHCRWNEVVEQLSTLRKGVSPRRDPELYLEFLALYATACCHAGRTDECRVANHEAFTFAKANNDEALMLRLRIDALVAAQDDGDLSTMRDLADGLSADLEDYAGAKKNDLLMRYHGTMAQYHAWGTLQSLIGCTQEAALAHVQKAEQFAYAVARELPSDAGEAARDEAESNICQDLNYRHLWHAMFAPGTEAETQAWEEARQQQCELSKESATTNSYHLQRQRSLAAYNAWLQRGMVAGEVERNGLRLPKNDAEGWLVCANRRHLGALAAAEGAVEEAKACFAEGEAALPDKKCCSPVLGSIRFALLVQAALSLRYCGAGSEVGRYMQMAESLYDRMGESKLFGEMHAAEWIQAMRTLSAPNVLKQFYY